ncbi:MAG TPA: glutathione S-transferase family protein [Sphingomonas sp.]|nr:glutathione S-transferase family protein [Sphingomonas sp.]
MTKLTLFHMPGACSRVVLNALEEAGASFDDRPVNIMKGEQRSPEMLAVNPKGKVPALAVEGRMLTENPAILLYLHEQYPEAKLLPATDDALDRATQRSDLIWISNSLHPLVRMILMPARVSSIDPDGVRLGASEQLERIAATVEARLRSDRWWYDQEWSIIDVYLYWAFNTAAAGRFDLSPYPAILAHAERVRSRPSFQRALARERAAVDTGGMTLPRGASL